MPRREEERDSIYNTQFSHTKKQANEFGTLFRNTKMDFGVAKLIRPDGRQYKAKRKVCCPGYETCFTQYVHDMKIETSGNI
jgi:hypothetical protein